MQRATLRAKGEPITEAQGAFADALAKHAPPSKSAKNSVSSMVANGTLTAAAVAMLDTNGDGTISQEEFMTAVLASRGKTADANAGNCRGRGSRIVLWEALGAIQGKAR